MCIRNYMTRDLILEKILLKLKILKMIWKKILKKKTVFDLIQSDVISRKSSSFDS